MGQKTTFIMTNGFQVKYVFNVRQESFLLNDLLSHTMK